MLTEQDCTEELNLNINDKVYVYCNEIFPFNIWRDTDINEVVTNIDEGMFGVVTDIKRWENTDLVYDYYCYKITIQLNNGKKIKIKDNHTHILFRRYEFITLKDLQEILGDMNEKLQETLNVVDNCISQ